MVNVLKDKKIIIFFVILILCIFCFFKGITFSTLEGIFYLEVKDKTLYSAQYDSLEKLEHYEFITKREANDKPVIEYMDKEGYELIDRNGAIYIFSNGGEKEVISKDSVFNKYYIWKN